MKVIKPLSNTITLSGTGNSVFDAKRVFVAFSAATGETLITLESNTGSVKGTFVIPFGSHIVLEKESTDVLKANNTINVYATKIAFLD